MERSTHTAPESKGMGWVDALSTTTMVFCLLSSTAPASPLQCSSLVSF
ncbi:hypothetical protein BRADI_1g42549v3 [Brachypodium distachyon]|uniref:Uncharacterized protein n=1 Tax=Brachypodium distachyon TaxID=15368 RepID=A0A2K2DNY7_BRADI|nr:hypothetical protein BRADI_1g42549v3 [Brachypodium distachyon]